MGLGLSYGHFAWSYTSFGIFRKKLAAMIGIRDLNDWWHEVSCGNLTEQHGDAIFGLLDHPDNEGELTAEQCRLMAPRIRQLISGWEDNKYKIIGEDLAKSMDLAASEDSPLEFC